MERKYYLRGLGLGIAVTAVIMGFALSGKEPMTNEEIIVRAKELGLVENTVLADTENEDNEQENMVDDRADAQDVMGKTPNAEVPEQKEVSDQNEAAEPNEDQDAITETGSDVTDENEEETGSEKDNAEQNDDGEEDAAPEDVDLEGQDETTNPEEEDTEAGNVNEIITSATVKVITINSGDSSYTVAKKLENAGVVTSASTFDTFLCQNGYDKKLRTGNFSIPADASDEQIARIVTGME